MERDRYDDAEIRRILSYRRVAVVRMSRDPQKAAHYVPKYLMQNGFDVTPVNPSAKSILGKRCYPGVSHIESGVDIIDVFRPSDKVLPIVQEAIKKKPKVVWLQEGIHNEEAEELARSAGIDVVFNRCMFAEHRRLF